MSADPADIAKFTQDGVVLIAEDTALRDDNPDAVNETGELEFFYVSTVHAQSVLNERFDLLSRVSAIHEGIELADDIGFGSTIPLVPTVPCFQVVDDRREIDTVARTRAYVYQAGGDRYSVEVVE